MSSVDLQIKSITEIQVKRRREKSSDDAYFRSYAGMTRIRFKGPAQRHLSIVTMLPSEWDDNCRFSVSLSSGPAGPLSFRTHRA